MYLPPARNRRYTISMKRGHQNRASPMLKFYTLFKNKEGCAMDELKNIYKGFLVCEFKNRIRSYGIRFDVLLPLDVIAKAWLAEMPDLILVRQLDSDAMQCA